MKTCTTCKETKAFEEFHKRAAVKDGYKPVCKVCSAKYNKAWKQKNKENIARSNARYYAANKEYWVRYYNERNPWRGAYNNALIRVRQFGLETVTYEEFRDTLLNMPQCCAACGTTDRLTVDHIVPMSRGGHNVSDNLQILCKHHNSVKHTRVIDYRTAA